MTAAELKDRIANSGVVLSDLSIDEFAEALIKESRRLDWMISNGNSDCGRAPNGSFYVSSWVPNGAPGNESGGGGRFSVSGASHRECIDKFLAGDIKRFD